MSADLYLGLDLGTSGARALVIDVAGEVVASGKAALSEHGPNPRDPRTWAAAASAAVKQALAGDGCAPRARAQRRRHFRHGAGGRRARRAARRGADVQRRRQPRRRARHRRIRARRQRRAWRDQRPRQGDAIARAEAQPGAASGRLDRLALFRALRHRRQQCAEDRLRSRRRPLGGLDRRPRLQSWPSAGRVRAGSGGRDGDARGGDGIRLRHARQGGGRDDRRLRLVPCHRRVGGRRRRHRHRHHADAEAAVRPADFRAALRRLQPSAARALAGGRRVELRRRRAAAVLHAGRNGRARPATRSRPADRARLLSAEPARRALPGQRPRFRAAPDARVPCEQARFLQGLFEGVAAVEALGYARLAELGAPPLRSLRTVGGGARNAVWTRIRARVVGAPMREARSDEAAYGAALLAKAGA